MKPTGHGARALGCTSSRPGQVAGALPRQGGETLVPRAARDAWLGKMEEPPWEFFGFQLMGLPGYPNLSHFMVFVRESTLVMTGVVPP